MLITDPADPRLDDIRNLNKSDKSGEGLVIAEGPLVVSRLAESRFPMRCLVGFPKKVEAYISEYGEPECPIYEVSRETLAEVAGFDMHRGLVAAADRAPEPEVSEIVESAKTIAVLEGVGDHENIGAIFRSAAALGKHAVLLSSGCSDPFYRRAARVSMGTVFQIPWTYFPKEADLSAGGLTHLKAMGYKTAAMALKEDSVSIDDPGLLSEEKLAVILGTEGDGLASATIDGCDYTVMIPMAHGVDSLNVAAASAVAFWELSRH